MPQPCGGTLGSEAQNQRQLGQSHSAGQEKSQDLNQGTLWPDTTSSTSTLDFLLVRVGGF